MYPLNLQVFPKRNNSSRVGISTLLMPLVCAVNMNTWNVISCLNAYQSQKSGKILIFAVMEFKTLSKKKKVVQLRPRRNHVSKRLEKSMWDAIHQDHWTQWHGCIEHCLGAKAFVLYCNQLWSLQTEGLQRGY